MRPNFNDLYCGLPQRLAVTGYLFSDEQDPFTVAQEGGVDVQHQIVRRAREISAQA